MTRLLKFMRRGIVIGLIAAVLAAQPTRPAHAFLPAVLVAAVSYIGDQMLELFAGDGKRKGVLLALETELPIMLTTVELKTNENVAKASAAAHQQRRLHEAYKKSEDQLPADVFQANCQVITGLADVNAVRARSQAVSVPLIQETLQHTASAGHILTGRNSLKKAPRPNDAILAVKQEDANHACRYGTENDLKKMQALGCKDDSGNPVTTVEQIRANPYRGRDTQATTLLNAPDFKEDRAYVAALDYCTAMTGNRPLNYAEGRALSEDLGNIRQFLITLSDNAARDLSLGSCAQMLRNMAPLNMNFANVSPALGKVMAYSSVTSTDAGRTSQQVSDAAKDMLKEGLNYQELSAAEAKKKEADYAAAVLKDPNTPPLPPYVIKEQQVSFKQNDEAVYVARWFAPKFSNKLTGKPAQQYSLLLFSRVANLQLMWRQYEELERQTLSEAVTLARMVRGAPGYGDPPPVAARQ